MEDQVATYLVVAAFTVWAAITIRRNPQTWMVVCAVVVLPAGMAMYVRYFGGHGWAAYVAGVIANTVLAVVLQGIRKRGPDIRG